MHRSEKSWLKQTSSLWQFIYMEVAGPLVMSYGGFGCYWQLWCNMKQTKEKLGWCFLMLALVSGSSVYNLSQTFFFMNLYLYFESVTHRSSNSCKHSAVTTINGGLIHSWMQSPTNKSVWLSLMTFDVNTDIGDGQTVLGQDPTTYMPLPKYLW